MTPIEWQSVYETGIDKIDEQHKQFIDLINQLERTTGTSEPEAEAQEVLVKLVDHIRHNFSQEEKLMAENQYAHTDQHAQLHHRASNADVGRTAQRLADVLLARFLDDLGA